MEIVDYVKDRAIPVQIKEGVCGPTGRHSQDRIHGAPGSGRLCAGKGAGVSGASIRSSAGTEPSARILPFAWGSISASTGRNFGSIAGTH
jgi:hypothetical protein